MSKSAACVVCGVVTPVQIYTDKYYCTDHFPPPEESTLKQETKKLLSKIGVVITEAYNSGETYVDMAQFQNDFIQLIQERERLARTNELERIMSGQKTVREYVGDVDDIITYVFSADEINERLKDLSKQAVKVKE